MIPLPQKYDHATNFDKLQPTKCSVQLLLSSLFKKAFLGRKINLGKKIKNGKKSSINICIQ